MWIVTLQNPHLVVPSLREAGAAGNTSDVDVDQQVLVESAGGDSLPGVPVPDVPLTDVPLPEARPDGSGCKEWTSPRGAE